MIVIYGMPGCGVCQRAIALAEDTGLRYTYKDATDPAIRQEFEEKFPGLREVPQITWYDRYVGGYTAFAEEIANTRNYGDGPI